MKCKRSALTWKGVVDIHITLTVMSALLISSIQCAPASRDEVIFYEDTQFNGDRLFLGLGSGCYTMEKDWDNRISSVDLHGYCLMAYEKADCRGSSIKLSEGSSALADLGRVQFDNMLTSIMVCSRGNERVSERKSDNNGPEIWRVGVEEHNRYRRMHGVPPLSGDRQLHDEAQEHADYLAKNNLFELSPQTKYGENLATSYAKDKLEAVREVIQRWYEKIDYYNFRNPEANKDRPKSAQFSSLIWKSTTHMGIGVARNDREKKWIIVVFYDPAATRSKYRENVPPPVKEAHTDQPDLARTSLMSSIYNQRNFDDYV